MKISNLFAFVLMICLPFSAMAQDAWTRVSPLPQENTINDITKIPGTNRLIAVGDGSTIMTSDDSGETWDVSLHPAGMSNSYFCKGIHFISETTGFINGIGRTILKTTDAGLTWALKYDGSTANYWQSINDICFVDQTTGFAVGDNGLLLTTTDTGETWLTFESGADESLQKIVFLDNMIGFIFSSFIDCLKTTDGGMSWSWEPLMPEMSQFNIYDCHFVSETTGFVYLHQFWPGEEGFIYKTGDSGLSWNLVSEHSSIYDCKFAFYDEQIGMASCATFDYENKILQTVDGGNTWTEVLPNYLPWNSDYAMIYIDQTTALTLGRNGIVYKTTDGGLTWQPKQMAVFTGAVFKSQFIDTQNGFVLTDTGSGGISGVGLQKTTDGGASWTLLYDKHDVGEFDFYFLNAETGFLAVCDFDTLRFLKTENAGITWDVINTTYGFDPIDIQFFDQNHGIIVGESAIIKTADGGLTWENVTPEPGYAEYSAAKYRSGDEVYVIGRSGNLNMLFLKSTDGGSTWQIILIEGVSRARAIALPDENTIVIAESTSIYKSGDNGDTWIKSVFPNPDYFYIKSLLFPTPQVGYALGHGEFSNIVKTTDGGNTWFSIETNVSSALNAAYFFDEFNGVVFGDLGIVLKTTTGGVLGIEKPVNTMTSQLFTAAPNPFVDEINIRVNDQNVSFPLQVNLTDITGRELLNQQIKGAINQFSLSVNNLKPGIYLCQIISRDGRKETIKLIKR